MVLESFVLHASNNKSCIDKIKLWHMEDVKTSFINLKQLQNTDALERYICESLLIIGVFTNERLLRTLRIFSILEYLSAYSLAQKYTLENTKILAYSDFLQRRCIAEIVVLFHSANY